MSQTCLKSTSNIPPHQDCPKGYRTAIKQKEPYAILKTISRQLRQKMCTMFYRLMFYSSIEKIDLSIFLKSRMYNCARAKVTDPYVSSHKNTEETGSVQ